ncbi:hypothetical protein [Microbacterium sp. USHLN186]|uniref:hypothetical protein n=1 Tax=Microbacterium sp. USHLN186 TaxID=3081286 RepID=UPI003018B663
MPGFALKTVIIVIAIALLVIVVARAFRRGPVEAPGQRMPLLGVLSAAALLAVGFLLALISFTSQYTADLLPLRIAAVVAVVAGAVVLLISTRRARRR